MICSQSCSGQVVTVSWIPTITLHYCIIKYLTSQAKFNNIVVIVSSLSHYLAITPRLSHRHWLAIPPHWLYPDNIAAPPCFLVQDLRPPHQPPPPIGSIVQAADLKRFLPLGLQISTVLWGKASRESSKMLRAGGFHGEKHRKIGMLHGKMGNRMGIWWCPVYLFLPSPKKYKKINNWDLYNRITKFLFRNGELTWLMLNYSIII